MTVTSNDDFAKRVIDLATPTEPFKPVVTYDPDGDCIEFLVSPAPFYAERVDDLVTVYYDQETQEVIGSLVKGVSKFCQTLLERMPGFKIEIHDGRVKLEHLFRARLWSLDQEPRDLPTVIYRKLIDIAEQADLETEMCLA